jgi:hypothetical protein
MVDGVAICLFNAGEVFVIIVWVEWKEDVRRRGRVSVVETKGDRCEVVRSGKWELELKDDFGGELWPGNVCRQKELASAQLVVFADVVDVEV